MKAIFKKELRALMGGLRGWGYIAIMLLGGGVSAFLLNLLNMSTRFEASANYIALFLIPATVAAATDSFMADRRQNTERLIFSLPIKNSDIVLGKLLAHLVPVAAAGAGLCVFPLILSLYGQVGWCAALSAILAITVLGAAMMAIGLCISACSRSRLIAVLGIAVVLIASWASPMAAELIASRGELNLLMMASFMMVGFAAVYLLSGSAFLGIFAAAAIEVPVLLAYLQGTGAELMASIGKGIDSMNLFGGLNPFINGLFDGRVLIGWLAVAALFAFVTALVLAGRRQAKRRAL